MDSSGIAGCVEKVGTSWNRQREQESQVPAGTAGNADRVGTGGTAGCAGQVPAERQGTLTG